MGGYDTYKDIIMEVCPSLPISVYMCDKYTIHVHVSFQPSATIMHNVCGFPQP